MRCAPRLFQRLCFTLSNPSLSRRGRSTGGGRAQPSEAAGGMASGSSEREDEMSAGPGLGSGVATMALHDGDGASVASADATAGGESRELLG